MRINHVCVFNLKNIIVQAFQALPYMYFAMCFMCYGSYFSKFVTPITHYGRYTYKFVTPIMHYGRYIIFLVTPIMHYGRYIIVLVTPIMHYGRYKKRYGCYTVNCQLVAN